MTSLDSFTEIINKKLTPFTNKLNGNIWVQTIRDSILQLLPFIFLGSIFTMVGILNEYIPWVPPGYELSSWTFGKVGIFIAFLVPFNYCEKKRMRKNRLIAGTTGIVLFLMMISPQVEISEAVGFGHSTLGAGGMICAMIGGAFTAMVVQICNKFSFFKKGSSVPDFIREWFDLMVPIFVVVMIGWVLIFNLNLDLFGIIQAAFSPLSSGMQFLPVYILFELIRTGLYALGVSNWALTGIWTPIVLAAIASNAEMVANGTATIANLNLITNEATNMYLLLGGGGATLSLTLMMLKAKSKKLKTLGKAGLFPSIFNINEPIVFGCIAWNPIMMIPFLLNSIILPIVMFIFTKVIPFAPIPTHVFNLWFCPSGLLAFLTTGSFTAVLLALLNFVISGLIYYPFFKAYDKQEFEKENITIEAK